MCHSRKHNAMRTRPSIHATILPDLLQERGSVDILRIAHQAQQHYDQLHFTLTSQSARKHGGIQRQKTC